MLVSAHRGGAEVHPPATLAAYADAAACGADHAEVDVRRLGDGTLAVFHDERVTPAGPALAALDHAELREAAGYEVPRVADVLAILAAGGLGVHLDLKETGYEADVVELTERFVGDRYVVTTLEDTSIRAVTSRYPHASAALSLGRHALDRGIGDVEARLIACGAGGIAVHHEPARRGLLDLAAARDLQAWVWTVDDDPTMRSLLADARVTALVTNRPHRAVELRSGRD